MFCYWTLNNKSELCPVPLHEDSYHIQRLPYFLLHKNFHSSQQEAMHTLSLNTKMERNKCSDLGVLPQDSKLWQLSDFLPYDIHIFLSLSISLSLILLSSLSLLSTHVLGYFASTDILCVWKLTIPKQQRACHPARVPIPPLIQASVFMLVGDMENFPVLESGVDTVTTSS